jgi:molybdopterin-guanine dinucleotide biosynthesis protein A
MGRDKALIEVKGRALARIAADALLDAGAAEVFAVGGDRAALEALGLRVVPDDHPGDGPLGGIVTALGAASADVVVVLACDLPWVTAEAVRAVVDALGDHDVAVPVVGDRTQHLLGGWRRDRALASLRTVLGTGERAVWRAMAPLRVSSVTLRDAEWARDADDADGLFPGAPEG